MRKTVPLRLAASAKLLGIYVNPYSQEERHMSGISITVRGLAGEATYDFDNGEVTVEDVRQAAGIAEGMVLRLNGQTVSDEASTPVEDQNVLVTSAPEAKHG